VVLSIHFIVGGLLAACGYLIRHILDRIVADQDQAQKQLEGYGERIARLEGRTSIAPLE
jgi:hypothetical protein